MNWNEIFSPTWATQMWETFNNWLNAMIGYGNPSYGVWEPAPILAFLLLSLSITIAIRVFGVIRSVSGEGGGGSPKQQQQGEGGWRGD